MKHTNHPVALAFAAFLAFGTYLSESPSVARAASNEVSITLFGPDVATLIDGQVNSFLSQNRNVTWDASVAKSKRVVVSRLSAMSMLISLRLQGMLAGFPIRPFTLKLRADFTCNSTPVGISLVVHETTGLQPVDELAWTAALEAGRMINERKNAMIDSVESALTSVTVKDQLRCTKLNVATNGGISVSFINEKFVCSAGQKRHTKCGVGYTGPGIDYTCNDNRWVLKGGYCERIPPRNEPLVRSAQALR